MQLLFQKATAVCSANLLKKNARMCFVDIFANVVVSVCIG